jgi:tetratricopeptide (TPR) repeat protein
MSTYKVFISSTGIDLEEYRQKAREVCERHNMLPLIMENFEAMGKGATEGSLHKLDQADIYVGIFAHRYGYIEDGYDKSVTELEFDHAHETLGLECLCFPIDPAHPWPPEYIDYENHDKLEVFKNRIDKKLIRAQFTTPDNFAMLLGQALGEWKANRLLPTGPLAPSLHQFPSPPGDFTGREEDLKDLYAKVRNDKAAIVCIRGRGGVGKTTLSLALAAELVPEYPDAQLMIDLQGAAEQDSLTPEEALTQLLSAFYPGQTFPHTLPDLQALYRSTLYGKRTIILLDNAANAEQAKPLLPPAGCLALVTSRSHVTLPGMLCKDLNALPLSDAIDLLIKIAPRLVVQAEALAKLCGCLPHALRVAGSTMGETPDLSPEAYITELRDESRRATLIEAPINLSLRRLDTDTQTHWRMLGVFPGSFDRRAAAAVWEVEEDATRSALSVLTRHNLIAYEADRDRYRLHDLTRVCAANQLRLEPELVQITHHRHAAHYLNVLDAADNLYLQGGDKIINGLKWYDLEVKNIQAGQTWAAAQTDEFRPAQQLVMQFPDAGTLILSLRQHPNTRISWLTTALQAAQAQNNLTYQGSHLGNLGIAHRRLGETHKAIEYYQQALEISREIGDRVGEGNRLGNLGIAYRRLGEAHKAIEFYKQALEIIREVGDRRLEGYHLGNLGVAFYDLAEIHKAVEYFQQALKISREVDDRRWEGIHLGNLGDAYRQLGEYESAKEHLSQALKIAQEIGAKRAEAWARCDFGNTCRESGEVETADEYLTKALGLFQEAEAADGTATVSWYLGLLRQSQGDLPAAIELMQVRVDYYQKIGHAKTDEYAAQLEEAKKQLKES